MPISEWRPDPPGRLSGDDLRWLADSDRRRWLSDPDRWEWFADRERLSWVRGSEPLFLPLFRVMHATTLPRIGELSPPRREQIGRFQLLAAFVKGAILHLTF